MRFVDEAVIEVIAGKGGDGCLSFRREKYIPFGGPDGGNGGAGAHVYLLADASINTLIDFRYQRYFKAPNGRSGMGQQRTGKSGEDLYIRVPVGTLVFQAETQERLGDLTADGQRLLVAQGGNYGLGNMNFKTSTNQAPRKTTSGKEGEYRRLRLELQVLADVGLLGLPNAGKSSLIRAVSAAKPRVADYPFTTLYPSLGLVQIEAHRSFVMADIPGLIAGAAEGAGLGIRFLKHLSRNRLLLHLVDIAPITASDPVEDVQTILAELEKYDTKLANRERWLVFNKIDLLPVEAREAYCHSVVERLAWTGPVFQVSAVSGEGCRLLCQQIMTYLEALPPVCPEDYWDDDAAETAADTGNTVQMTDLFQQKP